MEKFVKTFGNYRNLVTYSRYGDEFGVTVSFYDRGGDKARVVARKWNGRSWNEIDFKLCTKLQANEVAKKILAENKITQLDLE